MRKWTAALVLLLLCLSLVSCTKSKRTPAAGSSSAPAQAPSAAAGSAVSPAAAPSPAPPPPGSALDPRRTITLAREQPQPPVAAARKDTGISTLLSLGTGVRILPEDFRIGGLGDARVADSDERQAMAAADAFLSRLVAGKIDKDRLAPDSRARLSDTVSFGIEHGDIPRSYRIGAPRKRETGELSATVRLFGPVGTSEGEITMTRAGKQWLIDDFQINLSALTVKREKPKERFFPSSYRWMLEN